MENIIPLAERMRPTSLDNYIGQKHIVGEGAILQNAIALNTLPSIIFWGPPGVGKTTLANIIAHQLKRPFYALSAINSGVKDIREIIEKASSNNLFSPKTPYCLSMKFIVLVNRSRIHCLVLSKKVLSL